MKMRRASVPPPSASREAGLVPLSCPDCSGVLRFEREGRRGHLLYVCQVDHRYTAESLAEAKESQLEQSLWSACLLLKQLSYAYEDLMEEMLDAPATERRKLKRRIQEVKSHSLAIRAMIEATHAPE